MRKVRVVVLCLLTVLAALPAAWATTAVERTESDMIQEASIIVAGRCTNLQSQWAGRTLVTLATIQVSEALKGSVGSTVTVVLPGGVDSNRRIPVAMSYPAAPAIYHQEQVLLFLTPEDLVSGGYSIVGFSQGKFTLIDSPDGKKMATQDLGALNLQAGNGSVRRGAQKTIQLDELRERIRRAPAPYEKQR
jgi:hypothetical protein